MQDEERRVRRARTRATKVPVIALLAVLGLAVAVAPPVAADGVAYRDLQNRFPFPRTVRLGSRPAIRGHAGADARIHRLAEQRGYRLRPLHVGSRRAAAGVPLDVEAAGALEALVQDARAAGMTLRAAHGFRSVELQRTYFLQRLSSASNEAIASGRADATVIAALRWVAPPGYSKHHTGFAVDLRAATGGAGDFAPSAVGRWLAANDYARAKARGWVPSYPPGSGAQGPEPEPWEYTYVGVAAIRCGTWLTVRNDLSGFEACRRGTVIDRKYLSLGASQGVLGPQTEQERALSDGRGRRAGYRDGYLYWTETTGAREIHGSLLGAYRRGGGALGVLGYPVTDARTSSDRRWRYNNLERGRVYTDRRGSGSFWIANPVFAKHESMRGIHGLLGFVTSDPRRSLDGRSTLYQNFSSGRIYVLDGVAREIHGAVFTWHERTVGGVRGAYGYPTSDLRAIAGGAKEQRFEGGRLYYSAATGAHGLRGPVLERYLANGATAGPVGLPTTTERAVGDGRGRWAAFQRGEIYAVEGGSAHQVHGAVASLYRATGGPTGALGYPVGELDAPGPAVRFQNFEHGLVRYDATTGTATVVVSTTAGS